MRIGVEDEEAAVAAGAMQYSRVIDAFGMQLAAPNSTTAASNCVQRGPIATRYCLEGGSLHSTGAALAAAKTPLRSSTSHQAGHAVVHAAQHVLLLLLECPHDQLVVWPHIRCSLHPSCAVRTPLAIRPE